VRAVIKITICFKEADWPAPCSRASQHIAYRWHGRTPVRTQETRIIFVRGDSKCPICLEQVKMERNTPNNQKRLNFVGNRIVVPLNNRENGTVIHTKHGTVEHRSVERLQACGKRGADVRPDWQARVEQSSVQSETGTGPRAPDITIWARATGPSPGGALVPYGRAGTPAIDDASPVGCAMATRSASVCGVCRLED
jgi:hypothetical protein